MQNSPALRQSTFVRFLSCLFLIRGALFGAFLGLAAAAAFQEDRTWTWSATACAAMWIVLSVIYLIEREHCRCVICATHLFEKSRKRGRRAHHKAYKFLGSYRLGKCFTVLFQNFYRCNHCGESIKFNTVTQPTPIPVPAKITTSRWRGRHGLPTGSVNHTGRRIG